MKAIVSEQELAWRLGSKLERLREVASDIRAHYREWDSYDSRKKKTRRLRSPRPELMKLLKQVNRAVLNCDDLMKHAHGGVRGRSPCTNAEMHLGCRVLMTADVRHFFPSVSPRVVFAMFREYGFGTAVSSLLTRLTTFRGELPQGAPTSGTIANLLMALPLDGPTAKQALAENLTYTRFIDDVGLSGDRPQLLIGDIARRLSTRGLAIHRKRGDKKNQKLKIQPRSGPQEITGLLINSGRPTIARAKRDRVRAAIREMANMPSPQARKKAEQSVRGRIEYVRRFHPGNAARLEAELRKAPPQ